MNHENNPDNGSTTRREAADQVRLVQHLKPRSGYQPRAPYPVDPKNLKPPKTDSAVQPPKNGSSGDSGSNGR